MRGWSATPVKSPDGSDAHDAVISVLLWVQSSQAVLQITLHMPQLQNLQKIEALQQAVSQSTLRLL